MFISSFLKPSLLMINAPMSKKPIMSVKQTYVNTRPKCVKIILKWGIALIVLDANLPTDCKSYLIRCQLPKKHTELKNANLSGKEEYAVTVFDASSYTMKQNLTNRKFFSK